MSTGDALVTILASWLTAGLGGWLGPLIAGVIKRTWAEWKRSKAAVDSGAHQQQVTEQASVDAAANAAEEARRAADRLTATERERELAGWLRPGSDRR